MVRDKEIRYGIRDTIIFFFFSSLFPLRFPVFPVFKVSRILQVDRTKGFQPARSRRWGWQLWRIFFIHVTCLRARKKHILPIQGIVCMSFHPAKPSILKSPSIGGGGEGWGRPYIPSPFHLDSSPISVENFDELTIVFFWKHVRPCHNLSPPPPPSPLSWYKIYFFT